MKFTYKKPSPYRRLDSLNPGDLFRLADGSIVWLKTSRKSNSCIDVVDISNGSFGACTGAEAVIPLTGTLEVTEG